MALLHDVCAWAGRMYGPVTADYYALASLTGIEDPRARLARYVDADVLAAWEDALAPWFASGRVIADVEFDDDGEFAADDAVHDSEAPRVVLTARFTPRLRFRTPGGRQQAAQSTRWELEVWVDGDITRVERAWFRRSR